MVWCPDLSTYKFFCSKTNSKACGISCQFPVLLKVWNEPLYLMYLDEREAEGTAGAGWNVPKASAMYPTRRVQRPLRWHRCQVQEQPNKPADDPSDDGCWWSVGLVSLSQLSFDGRFGVAAPSRWIRSCQQRLSLRFCRNWFQMLLLWIIQNTSQMMLWLLGLCVINNRWLPSLDRNLERILPVT